MENKITKRYKIASTDKEGNLFINESNSIALSYIEAHLKSTSYGEIGIIKFQSFTVINNELFIEYTVNH